MKADTSRDPVVAINYTACLRMILKESLRSDALDDAYGLYLEHVTRCVRSM